MLASVSGCLVSLRNTSLLGVHFKMRGRVPSHSPISAVAKFILQRILGLHSDARTCRVLESRLTPPFLSRPDTLAAQIQGVRGELANGQRIRRADEYDDTY